MNNISYMKRIFALSISLLLLTSSAFADSFGELFGSMTSLFSSDDESTVYSPGETANLTDYDITLTNVLTSDGGSQYTPAKGYIYIILEFEIKNKTNEDTFISSMMCFSPTVDGKTYTISVEADAIAMISGKMQFDTSIDPGKTISGIVGYEIPEDWKELKITVNPDLYGDNKATFAMHR